jgi:CRISPR system Cascade subunit CasA
VRIKTVSVAYGDKDFFVINSWSDSISFNANLLSSDFHEWIPRITDILEITDEMVKKLGQLALEIAISIGFEPDKNNRYTSEEKKRASVKEEAYFRLDMPFRDWLANANPAKDNMENSLKEWIQTARDIILSLGQELISTVDIRSFVGRTVGKEVSKRYTAPEAHSKFRASVFKILDEE